MLYKCLLWQNNGTIYQVWFFMTIEVAVQYMWGCFSLANVKLSLLKRYVPFFIQNIIFCCRTNLAASNWKLLASCEMIHLRGNGSLWLPLGSDTISLMANFLWKPWVTGFICKIIRGNLKLLLCHQQLKDKTVRISIIFAVNMCTLSKCECDWTAAETWIVWCAI